MRKSTRINVLILLILVLIVVPAADFMLLLAAGGRIGWLLTLALAVLTGIIGAGLAKQQGMRTWIKFGMPCPAASCRVRHCSKGR